MSEQKPTTLTRSRVNTLALVLIAAILGATALHHTKSILIPFVLAVFISFSVAPLIDFLQKYCKLPKMVAVFTTIIFVIGLIVFATLLIVSNFRVFLDNLDAYRQQFFIAVGQIFDRVSHLKLGLEKENVIESLKSIQIFDYIKATASRLFSFTMNVVFVIIFIFFILTGKPQNLPTTGIWAEISSSIRKYLVTKVITSTFTGVLTAVILSILGVDMAIMFGLLAFLLNFIPTIGSIVAVLLPLPILLLQFDSGLIMTLAILLPGSMQFIIGSLIEPLYIGDALQLHPVTILLALMFWGLLWGIPGAILATPFCVILKICLSKFEGSKVFAELMAGQLPKFSSLQ